MKAPYRFITVVLRQCVVGADDRGQRVLSGQTPVLATSRDPRIAHNRSRADIGTFDMHQTAVNIVE
jgi:hypothetical protein